MITKKLSKLSTVTLGTLLSAIVAVSIVAATAFALTPYWWGPAAVIPVAVAASQTVMSALYTKGLRNGAGAREL